MKLRVKILVAIFFGFSMILFINNTVKAKSYSIENMNIKATIQQNGDLAIEQNITYKFNGSYNGIYITIPYVLEDMELNYIVKNKRIKDDMYTGTGIEVQSVSEGENQYGKTTESRAYNGISKVYTISNEGNLQKIKIYSPSTDTIKTFKVNYTIKNLCVKHNDIGELYYNFIGGEWEVDIKKLNIDVYLPENKENIKIWGHGPFNGISKIVNNNHANFQVSNVKKGQYVAARVMFDAENIKFSRKSTGINAKNIILEDENEISQNREEINKFTVNMALFAVGLLLYWIILLIVYEKDKKYRVYNIEEDEEELFKKYNPLLAGCIQGSRGVLSRDIIAVILNLIDKKIIKLEIKQTYTKNKEGYVYFITKNDDKISKMDNIEKYIYEWIFGYNESVELTNRLKELPKEKEAAKKFKELNNLAEKKLTSIGANKASVPTCVKFFNILLFIVSLVFVFKHIMFSTFGIVNSNAISINSFFMLYYIIVSFPLLMGIMVLPLNLIIMIRHAVNRGVQKITGQKVVMTAVSVLVLFIIIIGVTFFISKSVHLVVDEIVICIGTIIILTDNLMLKNSAIMIEDFSKLNGVKNKIENYSMMEDRDIEYITLWGKYLAYSVSFGIADKIIKRIKVLNDDSDIELLVSDKYFTSYLVSDYYYFYKYASLDSKFIRAYERRVGNALSSMAESSGSGGSYSGGRRRLFWWRRLFRWRRKRRPEAGAF